MIPPMGRSLGSFQHRVVRLITGRHTKRWVDGSWGYPPVDTAMEEAWFEEMGAYVLKRQNMVSQYIATRLILDLCADMVRRYGVWVSSILWDQEGL